MTTIVNGRILMRASQNAQLKKPRCLTFLKAADLVRKAVQYFFASAALFEEPIYVRLRYVRRNRFGNDHYLSSIVIRVSHLP